MPDILHIVPAQPFGGAQKLALDLAAEQGRTGQAAEMLWLSDGDDARAAAKAAGVRDAVAGRGLARVNRVRTALAGTKIAHLHIPPPWLPLALPSTMAIVLHLHVRPVLSVHAASMRRRLDARGEAALVKRADRLIAISEWVSAAWDSVYPGAGEKTSVVYNGLQTGPENRPEPGPDANKARCSDRPPHAPGDRPFTLGVACRLSDRKGIEEFLALAAAVRTRLPSARFAVAGDGPLRAQYEAEAAAIGLADHITFHGFVRDMARFWATVDVAAFTPPFEPFGLRLIEPVVHGVPVAAYRNGSGSDEVIDRCRGIVAAPYGDAGRLADHVSALAQSPADRAALARNGQEDIARHFSVAGMARGVARAYGAFQGAPAHV